jgi:hypothetical protein
VQELTADLDSTKSGDPTAGHALVVSLEFVRPILAAEAAQARGGGELAARDSQRRLRGAHGASARATHPNSSGDAAPSTTWSLIEMMPDGSLPRLKSCWRAGGHAARRFWREGGVVAAVGHLR